MGPVSDACIPVAYALTSPPARIAAGLAGLSCFAVSAYLASYELLNPDENFHVFVITGVAAAILSSFALSGGKVRESLPPCKTTLSHAMLIVAHKVTSGPSRLVLGGGGGTLFLGLANYFGILAKRGFVFHDCCDNYLIPHATSACSVWGNFTPQTIKACHSFKPYDLAWERNLMFALISMVAAEAFILYAVIGASSIRKRFPAVADPSS